MASTSIAIDQWTEALIALNLDKRIEVFSVGSKFSFNKILVQISNFRNC